MGAGAKVTEVSIVLVVYCLIMLFASFKLAFHFEHSVDVRYNQGLFCKVIAILGMIVLWLLPLLIPTDAFVASEGLRQMDMEIFWRLVVVMAFMYVTLLSTYALFYYDSETDKRSKSYTPWIKAAIWTLIFNAIFWIVFGILYGIFSKGDFPIAGCVPSETNNCLKSGRLDFGMWLLGFMMAVGWIPMDFGLGIGLVAAPLYCFLRWKDRPLPLTPLEYSAQRKALGDKASTLRSLGEGIRDQMKRVKNRSGIKGLFKKYITQVRFNKYMSSVRVLERKFRWIETSFKKRGANPLITWSWFTLGILFTLLGLLFLLQITIAAIVPSINKKLPVTGLLSDMFVKITETNLFFLVLLVFLVFFMYTLCASLLGLYKFSQRVPVFYSIDPLRKESTHLNDMLLYVLGSILCACALLNMWTLALNTWVYGPAIGSETYIATVFRDGLNRCRLFKAFNEHAVNEWIILCIAAISVTYFSIWPRDSFAWKLDTVEDLRKAENIAASWKDPTAPAGEKTGGGVVGRLGDKIGNFETETGNAAKGAIRGALNPI